MRSLVLALLLVSPLAVGQNVSGKWIGRFKAEGTPRKKSPGYDNLMKTFGKTTLVLWLGKDGKFSLKVASGPTLSKRLMPPISGVWRDVGKQVETRDTNPAHGRGPAMVWVKQGTTLRQRMPLMNAAVWIVCSRK